MDELESKVEEVKATSGKDLDALGAKLKLPRVTVAGGHPFDEDDESYARRLLAAEVGADVAGAERRPPVVSADSARNARRVVRRC